MTSTMRNFIAAMALPAVLASFGWLAPTPVVAQNLFEPVIKVNDQAITRYEIEQRARMLTLFRAPGDPQRLAREQLIEDRLKLDAARVNGLILEDSDIADGMEEFAGRANMTTEQFTRALDGAGVSEPSFREFVRAGLTWRELSRAKFAPRVSVSDADIERAEAAISGGSGVRVLLSEIIMPAPPSQAQTVQARAARISEITTEAEFAAEARKYSAAPSRGRSGRLDWVPITNLPPALRSVVIALAPGEVSDPLPLDGAVALFQLRDIEELDTPAPEYSAIEYAAYYIPGGRSDQARARAARVKADTDTCDDLYGIAQGQPPEVLERGSKAPEEIPQDIAMELAKLDPGEVSTTLTRSDGQTLVFLMLCGRAPKIDGEGPSTDELTNFIRSRRLESFANGYLEQLRAEARIIEFE
ncbi:Chaperone SurA precursor [Roseovarius litorisediminis]|uniref:Parvulin-like PPIase n=1 Tax=Roseovarius litorisediminis TaxID=1312363 RepID=A0A1Y5R615_9RHOB|nr:peptidylprolyl isomerase [Roseovarius litorisediminis]SLN09985.1 Chaperone SurA precursor [Roseovarius litorisediminis]